MMPASHRVVRSACAAFCLIGLSFASSAQPPASDATPAAANPAAAANPSQDKTETSKSTDSALAALSWLSGCYKGTVNQREFREHWLPLRGDLLVGASHTVVHGRTQDFAHLRVEPRADGIFYVITPGRESERVFRLSGQESDGPDRIFTFTTASSSFPQRILYRRGTGGWLYVHVEGRIGGEERKVIYPMRRIDCETDALIPQ